MAIRSNYKTKEVKFDALNSFLASLNTAQEIEMKYDLIVSNDVSIRELYIGYTKVMLKKDQDPADMNHFTSGTNSYKCTRRQEGLKVIVIADGMAGGFWKLQISVKKAGDDEFKAITDSPIKQTSDNMGHLDHNQFHN